MVVQIFGTKKCADTRKAERFFRERNVELSFRDIHEKAPSPGELDSMLKAVGEEKLLAKDGKAWKEGGWEYRDAAPLEVLAEHPELMRTPVVRCGKKAVAGFEPEAWKALLADL